MKTVTEETQSPAARFGGDNTTLDKLAIPQTTEDGELVVVIVVRHRLGLTVQEVEELVERHPELEDAPPEFFDKMPSLQVSAGTPLMSPPLHVVAGCSAAHQAILAMMEQLREQLSETLPPGVKPN